MSRFFQYPDPKTAIPEDIITALDNITDWDWKTGYSFAHIVIDDKNLGDGHILWCLQPNIIAEVMNQKIKDEFGHTDFDKLEKWQWGKYEELIVHMAEIIELLSWLLLVPEEIREQV